MSRPWSWARCFAVSISPGDRSIPVTFAPVPAASSATAPVPQARSSQRSPSWTAIRSRITSWMSAIVSVTFWYGPLAHITLWRCFSSSYATSRHLRFGRFLLLRPLGQLIARAPQGREEVVVDHLPQHLDRRPLRPHDLVADDPGDDLVVADPPHRDPLGPLDQGLGELVEPFVLASADVDLDDVEPGRRDRLLEGRAERRRHAAHLAEPRRVEAAAV